MTSYNLLRNTTLPKLQPTETIAAYSLTYSRAQALIVKGPPEGNDKRTIEQEKIHKR